MTCLVLFRSMNYQKALLLFAGVYLICPQVVAGASRLHDGNVLSLRHTDIAQATIASHSVPPLTGKPYTIWIGQGFLIPSWIISKREVSTGAFQVSSYSLDAAKVDSTGRWRTIYPPTTPGRLSSNTVNCSSQTIDGEAVPFGNASHANFWMNSLYKAVCQGRSFDPFDEFGHRCQEEVVERKAAQGLVGIERLITLQRIGQASRDCKSFTNDWLDIFRAAEESRMEYMRRRWRTYGDILISWTGWKLSETDKRINSFWTITNEGYGQIYGKTQWLAVSCKTGTYSIRYSGRWGEWAVPERGDKWEGIMIDLCRPIVG